MRPFSRVLLAAALLVPSAARADCHLAKYLDIPVTMRGARAIVSARIGANDAQFILDSGAFFSALSRASAQAYGLRLEQLPPGYQIHGVNGDASASLTTVRNFDLAGAALTNIPFIVGGTDTGEVGLLGQNFLGVGDVEYDLRHGVVRLLKEQGCKVEQLAYWAGSKPVTVISIEPRTERRSRTVATVALNGVKLRALFDTGAPGSVLTLSAAKRLGVTPSSPGVVASGFSTGVGSRTLPTWTATFDRIEIGGESIPHPKIHITPAEFSDFDMLIGIDFFLSHHIYVSNRQAKMLITYEGGTVFGVGSAGASDGQGKPLDLTDNEARPTDAEGFSRSGAAHASLREFDAAIADFDRAIALAPGEPRYLRQRAAVRLANHQPLLASADLDKALNINSSDVEAREMRAAMRLAANDQAGAADDVRILDRELPPSSGDRLRLAAMADGAGLQELALANDDAWLKAHPEDAARPTALNERCWVRGQLGRDLKAALDDCNAALRERPGSPTYLDSRALVRLRQGDIGGALADYNAALRSQPRNALTLYMRSIAKRRAGDATGADADRKAAMAIAPRVAERAAKLGLVN
jgi:predicted aspartyl protease/tetratricopeptide (TPR) repeat protein